jgi:TRAP-type C4-dicarboxylate transport system permease small subunit
VQAQPTGGALDRMSRGLSVLEDALNIAAAMTILIVMLATVAQVAARLSGHPVPGFLEASEQAIAIFAFLGVAYAQRNDAHIRMEMFVGAMRGRMRWLAEAFGTLIALAVIAVLIRYSWSFFLDAWRVGDVTLDYGIPTWPSKFLVPAAFSIWFLRLSLEFAGFLRLFLWPHARPVAVPIIKTTVETAKGEIDDAFGPEDKT